VKTYPAKWVVLSSAPKSLVAGENHFGKELKLLEQIDPFDSVRTLQYVVRQIDLNSLNQYDGN
jgi:hypothetical protein